jgi:hypothetical protein
VLCSIPACFTERDSKLNSLWLDLEENARRAQYEVELLQKDIADTKRRIKELWFCVVKLEVHKIVE